MANQGGSTNPKASYFPALIASLTAEDLTLIQQGFDAANLQLQNQPWWRNPSHTKWAHYGASLTLASMLGLFLFGAFGGYQSNPEGRVFLAAFGLVISILGAYFAGGTSRMTAFYCAWVMWWVLVVCVVLIQFLL